MIAAKLLVTTTRLTVGALFLIAFKSPVVPMMAGSNLRRRIQFQQQSSREVTTNNTHPATNGTDNRHKSETASHTRILRN